MDEGDAAAASAEDAERGQQKRGAKRQKGEGGKEQQGQGQQAQQQEEEAGSGASQPQQEQAPLQPQKPAAATTRTQIVVPVSSGYTQLTPALLHRLFVIRGVQVRVRRVCARVCGWSAMLPAWPPPPTAPLALRSASPPLHPPHPSAPRTQAQQLLLALVDANGVVTRCCCFNYVQAPLEGPGTATLELLDD